MQIRWRGLLDDQGRFVTNVMAMNGRIAPFELSFLELFFRKGSPEQLRSRVMMAASIRNVIYPSFPPTCANGIEDAGYYGYELRLITFAEELVDSVGDATH